MKKHISADALCPFYCSEDDFRIRCEGVVDGSRIHNVFGSSCEKSDFQQKYCNKDYRRCVICRSLYLKYAD